MSDEFRYLFEELRVIYRNLKKDNAERKKDIIVINRKLAQLNNLKSNYLDLRSSFLSSNHEIEVVNAIQEYIEHISKYFEAIEEVLKFRQNEYNYNNPVKMVDAGADKFNFKTASCLLPKFDGSKESIYQIIEGLELYEPSLEAASKKLLINYVLKACLSHRDKLRIRTSYLTVETLIADLKKHFLPHQSPSAILTRLQNSTQGSQSIEDYGRSITALMADLTISQSSSNNAEIVDAFKKQNEKLAVNAFSNGLRSHELRTILKARNFENLGDAINAAKDESVINQTSTQMLYANTQNQRTSNLSNHNSNQNYSTRRFHNHNRVNNNFGNRRGKLPFQTNSNTYNRQGNSNSRNFRGNNNYYHSNRSRGRFFRSPSHNMYSYVANDCIQSQGASSSTEQTFFRGPQE